MFAKHQGLQSLGRVLILAIRHRKEPEKEEPGESLPLAPRVEAPVSGLSSQ